MYGDYNFHKYFLLPHFKLLGNFLMGSCRVALGILSEVENCKNKKCNCFM